MSDFMKPQMKCWKCESARWENKHCSTCNYGRALKHMEDAGFKVISGRSLKPMQIEDIIESDGRDVIVFHVTTYPGNPGVYCWMALS